MIRETCKKRTRKSIMEFTVCSRPAVKDGFCTRHHPSYISPADQRALDEYDRETKRLTAEGKLPVREYTDAEILRDTVPADLLEAEMLRLKERAQ